MTLSAITNQRERDKFEEVSGKTTVRVKVDSSVIPDGSATSAKQLPDNHNVTVSNPTADPETGLSKDATLTDGSQVTKIKETLPTDSSKNNSSTVISGFSSQGDDLTFTDTIGDTAVVKTWTWSGSGPYTLTISPWEVSE
jgi:hypothetical protein